MADATLCWNTSEIRCKLLTNVPLLCPPFNVAFAGLFLNSKNVTSTLKGMSGQNVIVCCNICD